MTDIKFKFWWYREYGCLSEYHMFHKYHWIRNRTKRYGTWTTIRYYRKVILPSLKLFETVLMCMINKNTVQSSIFCCDPTDYFRSNIEFSKFNFVVNILHLHRCNRLSWWKYRYKRPIYYVISFSDIIIDHSDRLEE